MTDAKLRLILETSTSGEYTNALIQEAFHEFCFHSVYKGDARRIDAYGK